MLKNEIKNNLHNFCSNDLYEASLDLFGALGYTSERRLKIADKNDFKTKFLTTDFNETKLMFSKWNKVEFLFELRANDLTSNDTEISSEKLEDKAIEAYWFIAIELEDNLYTKKQLSEITREINKQRPIPVFILFKYGNHLTFSIIDRRINKRDEDKDVLEKVVLIKDINYSTPHRAHIDILSDIAFEKIEARFKVKNFVELHLNWLKALSVSELNKKFYTELSNWFFWMLDSCQLSATKSPQDNISFGIRMITRIIFNWFIKEKGLINEKIFAKQTYLSLLKPEYRAQGDLYYKVILQNLFFGCLSKPMDRREFVQNSNSASEEISNLYHYAKYLNNPQEIKALFKDIPFLNGGLFECADDAISGKYLDCFLDNEAKNFLEIPDEIFFLEEPKTVDLSSHFEEGKSWQATKVRGLFSILNYYKFTIDETTPVEEEIALDPELLGRVFENLLAAHNPETKSTARKSTGSYYTPREIVDYMCEQALGNYLKEQIKALKIENIDKKIKELFSYTENHSFTNTEVDELIKAVNNVKILDPACGSGAFPMGLLHKLVHILSKLDPHNKKWKDSQIHKASLIDDYEAREEAIKSIEQQFNDNEMDYSRKLYLIQNCIFGVDIQPLAAQISRLRFFISLIVDEKYDKTKPNMGILALPNLETKFVTANTLIDLPDMSIFSTYPQITKLKQELETVRNQYFRANSAKKKTELQNKDRKIREQIKQESVILKATLEDAAKLADWCPYDKDYTCDWFNSKWMFNVDKFDIVIANPPYIGEKGHKELFAPVKVSSLKEFYYGKMDYFYFFFHLALNLLKDGGACAFITTNYYITALGGRLLRKDFKYRATLNQLINFNELKIFESAPGQHNIITVLTKTTKPEEKCRLVNVTRKGSLDNSFASIIKGEDPTTSYNLIPQTELYDGDENYIRVFKEEENSELSIILNKIKANNDILGNICNVNTGIFTAKDDVFIDDIENCKNKFTLTEFEKTLLKPLFKNSDIKRFYTDNTVKKLLIYHHEKAQYKLTEIPNIMEYLTKHKEVLEKRRDNSLKGALKRGRWDVMALPKLSINFKGPKIVAPQRSKLNTFGYNECEWYASADVYFITEPNPKYELKYLLALLNSKLYYIWLYNKGKRKGETLELYQTPLSEIPIKLADKETQNRFTAIVDKMLVLSGEKDFETNSQKQDALTEYEKQLDIMVYKLYDLTYDEVLFIDNNFQLTREEYEN